MGRFGDWGGDELGETLAKSEHPPSQTSGKEVSRDELPVLDASRYIIEREVARGGMGRILAARDSRLLRSVAIKELLGEGQHRAARFRREALITARLQHPAIVPVYEAGRWPSGEPFYSMKLVAGRPLDEALSGRPLDERLALLPNVIAATDAIAYAHRERVIHRDLKPSNILLGDFGETVVIDWGVAKDLDAEEALPPLQDDISTPGIPSSTSGSLTLAGDVLGTPAYMAPEQARGEAVDERADVFALGAILYQVLTGVAPFQARSIKEAVEAAKRGEMVPLKERAKDVAPDLVAIVSRAMAVVPAQRYPSARELAEELRRFQTGQLVGAHHYTLGERIVRFVRRQRGVVAVGTISALLLLGLGTLAVNSILVERDRAITARKVSDTRRAAAEKLVDFVVSDLSSRLQPIGRVDLLSGLGQGVDAYYAALSDIALSADDTDRRTRALSILAETSRMRGDLDAALGYYSREQAELAALLAAHPRDAKNRMRRQGSADAALGQGLVHQARGNTDAALRAFNASIESYDLLLKEAFDDDEITLGAARVHERLGDLHRLQDHVQEMLAAYRRALALRQLALSHRPKDHDIESALARSHHALGTAYIGAGAQELALSELKISEELLRGLVSTNSENSQWQSDLVRVLIELAGFERHLGELDKALANLERTLPIAQTLVRRDSINTQWRRDLANLQSDLGGTLLERGEARQALARLSEATAGYEALVQLQPGDTRWQIDLTRSYGRRGDAYLALGEVASAIADFTTMRKQREQLQARDPQNPVWHRPVAWSYQKLATGLAARQKPEDLDAAIALLREVVSLRTTIAKDAGNNAALRDELALGQELLGQLLLRRGDDAEGLSLLTSAIAEAEALVIAEPLDVSWKQTLLRALIHRGEALRRRGSMTMAIPDLERAFRTADEVARKAPQNANNQALLAKSQWELARALRDRDRPRAQSLFKSAQERLQILLREGRLSAEHRALVAELGAGL